MGAGNPAPVWSKKLLFDTCRSCPFIKSFLLGCHVFLKTCSLKSCVEFCHSGFRIYETVNNLAGILFVCVLKACVLSCVITVVPGKAKSFGLNRAVIVECCCLLTNVNGISLPNVCCVLVGHHP